MSTLKDRTILISGASRGIGLAISKRCAQDGANIAIAAKTAEPHPKLPGTIYTAAEEIEAAGGKALPLICDIRDENAVQAAVTKTVETFGGIDIVINNASAINLTNTEMTPMKRFDLMHGVNARGTYCFTQAALPYLKKGTNPHILTNAPPLSMKPKWFENHVAYTMAKYGMSMCTLGWAEEFKEYGIAANSLWPKTAIATAAINMLGGEAMMKTSRKPDIMAEAAYAVLIKDAKTNTGNFYIDEEVLKEAGETDFDKYAYDPNVEPMIDFFLD